MGCAREAHSTGISAVAGGSGRRTCRILKIPMKNWKKIAEANDLRIPESEIDHIAPALDALESAFRALTRTIPDDVEPAITFHIFPESAE